MSPQVALENLYEINKNPSLTGIPSQYQIIDDRKLNGLKLRRQDSFFRVWQNIHVPYLSQDCLRQTTGKIHICIPSILI